MKLIKTLGVLAFAAMALMAFVSTASATKLETNGETKTTAITLESSIKPETSAVLKDTSGAFANTCKASSVTGSDSTSAEGPEVSGPISSLSFTSCTHEKVKVDKAGSLSVSWISGTTNGTVRSSGAEVTVPVTIFGFVVTATCTTNETDIGTLTGTSSGTSTMDINGVINCGEVLPSAKWEGTYVITGHSIGVVS